jgi:hypothetical protein
MIDCAQKQNPVGRVLGNADLHGEIGVVTCQRGFNGFGSLRTREVGDLDITGKREGYAAIGTDDEFGLHLGPSGEIGGNLIALAKPVFFILRRLELAQRFKRILLESGLWRRLRRLLRLRWRTRRSLAAILRLNSPKNCGGASHQQDELIDETEPALHAFAFPQRQTIHSLKTLFGPGWLPGFLPHSMGIFACGVIRM